MRIRWIIFLLLTVMLLSSCLFELPGSALNPSQYVSTNISFKNYVWEPLRKARLYLYHIWGASPNDIVGGESNYISAVMYGDVYFIQKYADKVDRPIFIDAVKMTCESGDPEFQKLVQESFRERFGIPAPECAQFGGGER